MALRQGRRKVTDRFGEVAGMGTGMGAGRRIKVLFARLLDESGEKPRTFTRPNIFGGQEDLLCLVLS